MEHLVLKTYDDVKDRSPLYCGGGGVLIAVMAWREFSQTGAMGLRFCLMLLAAAAFVGGAIWLLGRHRIIVEMKMDAEGEGEVKISRRGQVQQVVSQSQLAYVKREEEQVKIHYYEGEDLKLASFPIKGARKNKVLELVEALENWQA
ncbi:MAG: hypothetical protein GXP30_08415 [Verrucomicrobia bacterium]|nr:hypothetical protein [Verrucomicrobiota bacterium]